MSLISGCIISVLDYLSTDKLSLTTEKNDEPSKTSILLRENRKYVIPSFQREIRWQIQNVNTLLFDLSRGPVFLGNIILSIRKGGDVEIIDGQQRTTIIYFIMKAISSKYKNYLSVDSLCKIYNESMPSLYDVLSSCFLDCSTCSIDDELNQLPRYLELWKSIIESDHLADNYLAESLYNNLKKSTLNIIVEQSDDASESIRFFLDVNLKSVKLDSEDIFKGYLLSIDNTEETRARWVRIKKEVSEINTKNDWAVYPLMKLYEHFFVCMLNKKKEYSDLDFGEDFCLKQEIKIQSKSFYQGTHILEVVRDKVFLLDCLRQLEDVLHIINTIISNRAPSDSFVALFHPEKGKIDDIQIQNTSLLLKKVFQDPEVITKILALKYLLSLFDGKPHTNKEYKSVYSVFVLSSLFTIFANRKRSEKIYTIVRKESWINDVNEWIFDFSNSVEMTRGKLRAAYNEPEEDDDYSSSIRCRSIGIINNFVTINRNNDMYELGISNADDLNQYMVDKRHFSLEHFIIPESGCYKLSVEGESIEYSIPPVVKRYRNSLFNFVFIPKTMNADVKNLVFTEKLKALSEKRESIECKYSKGYLDLLSDGSFFKSFPPLRSLTKADYLEKLDSYFNTTFINDFLDFATELSKNTLVWSGK